MLSRLRARLTYANVIATLALFIALGGTGYAALKLPKNSVGSEQLKANSVTSAKVKGGSLRADDFKATVRSSLRGRRGRQGLPGPEGKPGKQGSKGAAGVPGSARAYATVAAETGQPPTFAAMVPSLSFASVTRTAPGVYCLATPLLTFAQRSAAIVSVREVGGGYVSGGALCTTGIEVQTRNAAGTPVDNIDFNILVP